MSSEPSEISREEAQQKARETLMFEIGNLPHLGDPFRVESDYVFPLYLRQPRVIFGPNREQPVDVKFMSKQRIGTVSVDGESGSVNRTDLPKINRRIRVYKQQLDRAVQQALVQSSAHHFSQLPFPTHRYTPILDILSYLLVEGPIDLDELSEMSDDDDESYSSYVDQLRNVDLVRIRNGQIEADSVLIAIRAEDIESEPGKSKDSQRLNAALAHFFREGADNIDSIRQILGPYLVLSGYYYKRAIDVQESLPVSEEEFKTEIERLYSGVDGVRKRFKTSRYLIQLENVGLLQRDTSTAEPAWTGDDEIVENLSARRLMGDDSGVPA